MNVGRQGAESRTSDASKATYRDSKRFLSIAVALREIGRLVKQGNGKRKEKLDHGASLLVPFLIHSLRCETRMRACTELWRGEEG